MSCLSGVRIRIRGVYLSELVLPPFQLPSDILFCQCHYRQVTLDSQEVHVYTCMCSDICGAIGIACVATFILLVIWDKVTHVEVGAPSLPCIWCYILYSWILSRVKTFINCRKYSHYVRETRRVCVCVLSYH